ncbi:nucleotidyltransferase family protein [Asaia astilbis]|uniref:nucleotidyltransferase family protein n=1 Tax=Asaia astilbis TaxID=610244 RepID=UPI000471C7CC|nr:nucleotidyltransferase family protein [Asaia astilbis]
MNLPALVLAGSRDGAQDPLAVLGGVAHKALLPVAGRPMIDRVLETLAQTSGIGPVYISIETPEALDTLDRSFSCLPTAKGPSGSVALALEAVGTPLLITTADHPLLQSDWIIDFVRDAEAAGCDLAVGIASRSVIERDVPGTKRTYIPLADLAFSGCNLFLLRSPRAKAIVTLWQNLERDRKHPLRMARTLGFGILLRALFKRLSSEALTARIHKLTGATVKLVEIENGRAAVDVDKPADLTLVETLLAQHP